MMFTAIRVEIGSALKKNLVPGLILQCFAVAILLAYFFVPGLGPLFDLFGDLKKNYGFVYSFFATALFGGVIPFCYLWWAKLIGPHRNTVSVFIFYVLFWGLKGVEVDFFYRLQANWFGNDTEVATIITKVAVDQFIYSALWAAPSITLSYLWMEHNYNLVACWRAMNTSFFSVTLPTVILSNWLVWIPTVSIVYSMPQELQIPLFNIVLCFWVLLLATLNKTESKKNRRGTDQP